MAQKKQHQLNMLIAKKEQYFSRVQNLFDLSRNLEAEADLENFRVRFESLEETKNKFLKIIDEINAISFDLEENYIPNYQILETFDELYCSILFRAKKILVKSESNLVNSNKFVSNKNVPRLPQIELPGFSGNTKEWPIFYECFKNLIDENPDLNDSDKIHYLIGKLSGKALVVCSGIPPIGDNYQVIWQNLIDKYQDKRMLADMYLEQILDFKPIQTASANNFNKFLEIFDTSVRALKKLDIADLFDFTLSYLALQKLDSETCHLFENTCRNHSMPSYEEIITFVKEQRKIYSRAHSSVKSASNNNSTKSKFSHSFVVNNDNNNSNKCLMCKATSHLIFTCPKFLEINPIERHKFARSNNLCINCLGLHKIISCKSKVNCKICHLRHNSLLHFGKSTPVVGNFVREETKNKSPTKQAQVPENLNSDVETQIPMLASISSAAPLKNMSFCSTAGALKPAQVFNKTVLLSTAIVHIVHNSKTYTARFLLDSASQSHFITIKCCRRLRLPFSKFYSKIQGIGVESCLAKGLANVTISSRFDFSKKYSLEALVVEKISDKLPLSIVDTNALSYINNLPLADNNFNVPGEIDGILGAELFPYLIGQKRIVGPPHLPVAVETSLGYVVMGNAPLISNNDDIHYNFFAHIDNSLNDIVKKFWEVEEIPAKAISNPDDVECENTFKSTYCRNTLGRYTVTLPFRDSPNNLGDSYEMALKRFRSLETKFKYNSNFRSKYTEVIKDYIDQGHMTRIDANIDTAPSYYIPHHGVFKIDSTSTPLRVVFDASSKTTSSFSLNDLLYTGPKLQSDVLTMFLNFRLYEIAFTADVRQMYRQILLAKEHRCFQRILWRFSEDKPILTYELNTVSFGIKSSPFLALRTIRQLAIDEEKSYPLASSIVLRDMYMDDLVTSVPNAHQANILYKQLVNLFKSGGFDLVKWAVNSKNILAEIPIENRSSNIVNFDSDYLKILGIQWQPSSDILLFKINHEIRDCTKRSILSTAARFFDPLGLIAPVILFIKLFIKKLWILHIDWDETPPNNFVKEWIDFQNELPLLANFKISRHLGIFENSKAALVGFCDACETSYGAVVYIRTNNNGKVNTILVCAKSKVSPMKIISIPRLELCAAYILAKLMHFIIDSFHSRLVFDSIFGFSDSKVALTWIRSSPHRWKIFVANRVSKIQELIPPSCWFHIDGKNNISDCLSRGMTPSRFITNSEWTSGPTWLKLEEHYWPISPFTCDKTTDLEEKSISLITTYKNIHPLVSLIKHCSNWLKLLRSTVYVLRFVKKLPLQEFISPSDLEKAEYILIQTIQNIHFAEEISLLQNNENLSPSFRKLRPFLHSGILRVGGRLVNSHLSFDSQHPILLPKKDCLVDLLIDHYHKNNFHTGPNLVLSLLRQRYWILSARSIVRYRIHKCNFCFKARPRPQFPLMGNLPPCRVQQAKPFLHTGVDYAGPLYITLNRKRGARSQKAYICLFVCLVTKALHLELVSDLSTANFLQAFKRFLSRRGLCSVMYSDCGTNFIGAKAALDEIYNLLNSNEFVQSVTKELSSRGIEWKFNPPASPHFGGLWESNVKSVKTHLIKVVGNQLLSYEEMNTLLIQIEALLNSRPLCVLSSDPAEPIALTPAHFLTLSPLTKLPATDLTTENLNRLDRYQLIDRMVQDYWKRWHLEYLNSLQTRERWNTSSNPIKVDTVVLLQQPNIPPLHWPLGRIVEIFPGKDGIVRVVSVKTKNGIFKRPVVKVFPLPTQ